MDIDKQNSFLATLFDPEDRACFGVDAYSIKDTPVYGFGFRNEQYVTINPLSNTRADENVAKFRNFLIEIDKLSLKRQGVYINKNNIPYSTLTYSGGKSLHLVISLTEPLANRDEYNNLVNEIYYIIDPDNKYIDKACRNPSRFTRTAEATRTSNLVKQDLIEVKGRVDLDVVLKWIRKHKNYPKLLEFNKESHSNQIKRSKSVVSVSTTRDGLLTRRAEAFLVYGILPGQNWRTEAMYACCDMARCGFDIDEIYGRLLAVDGFLERDSERIPSDAYEMVLQSGQINSKIIEIEESKR